jgi:hypothetical protein
VTDYTKSTNFATKDALSSGNPLKIVKGTEIDTEFNNIQTAIATKADLASPTFTGTVVIPTATVTTATITTANISGGSITGITDLAIADGGTGASTAANARTNLGLAIGTNVQAWDADLDTWATKAAPSGTVVGTSDSQTLTNKTLSSGLVMDVSAISSGTAVASTSGTSVQFASIPSWVKRITVMLQGVSTNGTSQKLFQLGTGGTPTFATSGYISNSSFIASGSAGTLTYTNGFNLFNAVLAADAMSGIMVFANLSGNNWVCSGTVGATSGNIQTFASGSIALGAALTAVRMTTANGTDTFDAGTINILYE